MARVKDDAMAVGYTLLWRHLPGLGPTPEGRTPHVRTHVELARLYC